jgi:hypothetical protein
LSGSWSKSLAFTPASSEANRAASFWVFLTPPGKGSCLAKVNRAGAQVHWIWKAALRRSVKADTLDPVIAIDKEVLAVR